MSPISHLHNHFDYPKIESKHAKKIFKLRIKEKANKVRKQTPSS